MVGGGIHLVEFAEFGKIAYPTSKSKAATSSQLNIKRRGHKCHQCLQFHHLLKMRPLIPWQHGAPSFMLHCLAARLFWLNGLIIMQVSEFPFQQTELLLGAKSRNSRK